MRRNITTVLALFALTILAAPAAAQICAGNLIAGTNQVVVDYQRGGFGVESAANPVGVTYGRKLTSPVGEVDGSHFSVTLNHGSKSLAYNDGYRSGSLDYARTGLEGTYSLFTTNPQNPAMGLCATTGARLHAISIGTSDESPSYFDVPLIVTASYAYPIGKLGIVAPFVAPGMHSYVATFYDEDSYYVYEVTEKGTDFTLNLGAVLALSKFSVGTKYTIGDYAFGERSRLSFSAGFNF